MRLPRRTTCKRGHPLSGENLKLVGKDEQRVCVACRNLRARNFHHGRSTERARYSHCPHGHAMTPENTRTKRRGDMTIVLCRACASLANTRKYQRDPARARALTKAYLHSKRTLAKMDPEFRARWRSKLSAAAARSRERLSGRYVRQLLRADGWSSQEIQANPSLVDLKRIQIKITRIIHERKEG